MPIDLKPINNDVIVRKVRNEIQEGSIILNPEEDETQKVFDILAVSDKVSSVEVGERVIIPWTRITDPFEHLIDGERCMIGVTDEKEILAVIDPVLT